MSETQDTMLDTVMPKWTSRSYHEIELPPDAAGALDAAEQLTWADVPAFHRVVRLAAMGVKRFPADGRVIDLLLDGPYTLLHRSDNELLIAAVLPAHRRAPAPTFGAYAIEEYARYQPKSGTKVAMNFCVRKGMLSTETRNFPVGSKARRMFGAYWSLIKIPSSLIRKSWLKAIVERTSSQNSGHDSVGRAPV